MKRMPYVAVHHSKALLKCIVRQPSILNFIKGPPHNLHTNFTGTYVHMTWNRAKSFEVFGMACSGLGSFRFASVVPVDFAIQITFQVLCSLIILLRHTYGLESVFMASAAYNLHGTKNFEVFGMACSGLGSFRFASVVPGDFPIQITFKALCSPAILLSFSRGIHRYGLESVLYGNVSGQFICEHKTWKC